VGTSNKKSVIEWLLEDDQPVVRSQTLVELIGLSERHPDVKKSRSQIAKRGWAADILSRQKPGGYWESKKDLYRPKYTATNWMAIILSDLGLNRDDPRVARTAELVLRTWMDESKENIFSDEVCIVGNTARFMTRFGYYDDSRTRRLFARLLEDQRDDGGWDCHNPTKGTLDGWEALAAFAAVPRQRRTRSMVKAIERGAEFYLERELLNEGGSKYQPWFRLHYPVHYYYDVLVGLDLITGLGYGDDNRVKPALEVLSRKCRQGKWFMERVHPDPASYAWGVHNRRRRTIPFVLEEVGQPSKWITFTALRVLKRVDEAS
jgi:hypothetical protein